MNGLFTTPGILPLVIVSVILGVRFAISHWFGKTIVDLVLDGFDRIGDALQAVVNWWRAFVRGQRGAQRIFRETRMELKDERA